jgi:hypothetical protein
LFDWSGAFGNASGPSPTVLLGLGSNLITLTVDDGNDGADTDDTNVTIEDTLPPSVNAGPDVMAEATSLGGAEFLVQGTTSDICGAVYISVTPAPLLYSLGSTLVTVTGTDASGNNSSDTMIVTVVDTTLPVLLIPANISAEAEGNLTAVEIGAATATDIFPVTVTNNAPDAFPLGATFVTWIATDANGNQATDTQTVTVNDTTPPIVFPPPDIAEDATGTLTIVDIGQATATDTVGVVSITNNAPEAGFPGGITEVTWFAFDASGNMGSAVQTVTINVPPKLDPIPDQTIDEGDTITLTASFADPDSASWTATVDYGDGGGTQALAVDTVTKTMALSHMYVDNGAYTVTVSITDAEGASDTSSFVVTANNTAPALSSFLVAPSLVELSAHTVSASVDFTDLGILDTHTAAIDWGDGTTESATVSETEGSGSASGTHQYPATGVYTVTISATDKDGATSSSAFQYVVVYDSSSGFVTGGGWINSPIGACQLTNECSALTGKANFGFVSKYKKGATTPTGKTEFQFKAGDLNFHSSSYDWLIIAGHRAQFKGVGMINGGGNYGFMLFAIDADLTPSTTVDLFRIKIWDRDNGDLVVYDNELGSADDANPITAIGGGSIVIHDGKNK